MNQAETNNSNNNCSNNINNNKPNDIPKKPGACGNCNIKRRSLITFPCKYIICSKCLEKCASGKRYKCDNCDKAHNLVSNVTDTDLLEKIKQLNNKTNTLNNCYLEILKQPGRKRRLSVDNLPIGQQNNTNNSNNNLKRKRLSLGDNLKISTTTNDENKINNEIIRKRVGRKSLIEQQKQQQQDFHSHLTDKTNSAQTLLPSNIEQNTNKRRSSTRNSIQNSDNISLTLNSSSNEKPSASSSASSQSKLSNENTLNNKNENEQEKEQEKLTTNPIKLKSILKRNESVTTDSGINSQSSLTIEASSNNVETQQIPQKRTRKSSIKSSNLNENAKQQNEEEKKATNTKNENINTSKENIDSNKAKSKRNSLKSNVNENAMNENKTAEKQTPQPKSNARSRSRSRKKLVDDSKTNKNNNTQALGQITNTQNRRQRSNSGKFTTTNTSKQTTQINEYNKSYVKLPFDFKRSTSKGKLKLHNKFKLNGLSDKRNEYVCIKPIYDNKLLFCYRNTVYIRDQLGNVLKEKKLEIRARSIIREIALNDKFIFVSSESQISNEVFISKYDYEFNYIDEIVVYCECFSLACNNNRLFYVGLYYDILYRLNHTVIYVYDCETFQFVTELLWEGSNDNNNSHDNNNDKNKKNDTNNNNNDYENKYLPDRYLGPPQTIIYHNRIYFCYSNYGDDTHNRVDFANTETLINEGTLMMPEWFLNYKIDANGNFVYYQHDTKSFCVFNSNGELIRQLELDIPLNNYGVFCITNDGRLAVVRETFDVEIY